MGLATTPKDSGDDHDRAGDDASQFRWAGPGGTGLLRHGLRWRAHLVTYGELAGETDPEQARKIIWGQVASDAGFRIMAYDVQPERPWQPGENAFYVSLRGSSPTRSRRTGRASAPARPCSSPSALGLVAPLRDAEGPVRDHLGRRPGLALMRIAALSVAAHRLIASTMEGRNLSSTRSGAPSSHARISLDLPHRTTRDRGSGAPPARDDTDRGNRWKTAGGPGRRSPGSAAGTLR